MLEAKFIREHADQVKENCRNRNLAQAEQAVDHIVAIEKLRKDLIQKTQQFQQRQNEVAKLTGKEKDPATRDGLIREGRELKEQVGGLEKQLKEIEAKQETALKQIPNMAHPQAPVGREAKDNKVVKKWDEPAKFDFKIKNHIELCEKLDLADFEAGSTVAGQKFYFLKNEGVLLELALIQYAMQTLIQEGFTPVITPDVARQQVLEGIGFIPRGPESNIYTLEDTDLCLIATAEITLGGMHLDQVLEAGQMPIRYVGLSHCFRREAGAAGKETRGLYRVHQFTKVEMFVYCLPEESDRWHEQLLAIEEKVFQGLRIPYQVIDTCTGDLGAPAYRKYDIEAWMPGRGDHGEYGEVTSTSNCTDYQARRLNIRYRLPNQKGTRFAHTLNGTAVAVSRAILAILENYQQADGSVIVPEVLRPWVGKDRIGPK
jgi:seryl-tRNA synthetase